VKKIAIIGAGNVGRVIGYALAKKGYHITGIVCRTAVSGEKAAGLLECPVYSQPEQACKEAEIIFLTTPDRVIKDVCEHIAAKAGFCDGQVVLHTSGAYSSKILSSASREGARVISFHPLQSFAAMDESLRSLPGTFFAVEGDERCYPLARELVQALEGELFIISTEMKELYHAAACLASNYFVSLIDMALRCFKVMDVPEEKALSGLMPLVSGTLSNIARLGPAKALTGPIARGDLITLSTHIDKMEALTPELVPLYKQIGLYTAGLAVRKGTIDKSIEKEMKTLLQGGGY